MSIDSIFHFFNQYMTVIYVTNDMAEKEKPEKQKFDNRVLKAVEAEFVKAMKAVTTRAKMMK